MNSQDEIIEIKVNKAQRAKILKFIENQKNNELFEDDEYPADHPSWTGKWCNGCKSYRIKGKWIGCEDCDKMY
jgi:hypothetical protein